MPCNAVKLYRLFDILHLWIISAFYSLIALHHYRVPKKFRSFLLYYFFCIMFFPLSVFYLLFYPLHLLSLPSFFLVFATHNFLPSIVFISPDCSLSRDQGSCILAPECVSLLHPPHRCTAFQAALPCSAPLCIDDVTLLHIIPYYATLHHII